MYCPGGEDKGGRTTSPWGDRAGSLGVAGAPSFPFKPAPPGDARQVFPGPLSQQLFCYPQPHACQRLGLSRGCKEEGISRMGSPKVLLVPWAALPPHSSFSTPSRASPAVPCKSPTPTHSISSQSKFLQGQGFEGQERSFSLRRG